MCLLVCFLGDSSHALPMLSMPCLDCKHMKGFLEACTEAGCLVLSVVPDGLPMPFQHLDFTAATGALVPLLLLPSSSSPSLSLSLC